MDALTIGQLAERAGVHTETIRYYERRRLLREPPRTDAGYRQYSDADLRRLQFIARAKGLGFTLSEIADLIPAADGPAADNVLRLAGAKLREVEEHQEELRRTEDRLHRLIAVCADPDNEDCTSLRLPT